MLDITKYVLQRKGINLNADVIVTTYINKTDVIINSVQLFNKEAEAISQLVFLV